WNTHSPISWPLIVLSMQSGVCNITSMKTPKNRPTRDASFTLSVVRATPIRSPPWIYLLLKMLSLPLQRASVIDYLEDPRGDLTRGSTLLARIPANLTIFDASGRKLLRDRDSDAWILWRHIKALSGFGRTYTSKLLARK